MQRVGSLRRASTASAAAGERPGAAERVRVLLGERGQLFSAELGIDVERQPFRWLLASILFGGRISETVAKNTYRAFEWRKLLSPQAILRVGWDGLIPVMGEGGYVRYDGITSTKVVGVCTKLLEEYGGSVENIHATAHDSAELARRLLAFKGIGPVTVSIFLRELRGVWPKADPLPTDVELLAARTLHLVTARDPNGALAQLKALWRVHPVRGYQFRHLETALVRLGLDLRRRARRRAPTAASLNPTTEDKQ
jgi:endonuclease III